MSEAWDWAGDNAGMIGGAVVGGMTGGLGTAAIGALSGSASDGGGGGLFSDGKYDAQGAATYGAGQMSPEEYNGMVGQQSYWAEQLKNANNDGMRRIAQEHLDEINGVLGQQNNATKEAAWQRDLANKERSTGQGWAETMRGAGGVDQTAFNEQQAAQNQNMANQENFLNQDVLNRARGGYEGSASQLAASAQAAEGNRALAAAQASRGGPFHGAQATNNAMVDQSRAALETGTKGFANEKATNMDMYMRGNQAAALGRTNAAQTAGNFQSQITQNRINAYQSGWQAQQGFGKNAMGYEALGQAPRTAELEARESANRRADAAAANAANAPKIGDRVMSMVPAMTQAAILSDERVKWGRKRQTKKTKLDSLMGSLKENE